MGWFNKIEDGSRTILLVAQSSAANRRNFAIGAIVLVVGLVVGGTFLFRHLSSQSQEQVETAWTSLHQCVLGAPLNKDERPSMRFRSAQLTALTQPVAEGASSQSGIWPDRCAVYAHTLHEGLVNASRAEEGSQDLAYWAAKLAEALKGEGAVGADLSDVIEGAWAQADKEGLKVTTAPANVPAAPAPMSALNADGLKTSTPLAKKSGGLDAMQTDMHAGTALHLLVDDAADTTMLCTLEADAEAMQCEPLPVEIPASELGLRLLGTEEEGAAPLVFVGRRGSEGAYRTDSGAKVAAATSLGGYATKGGFASVLAWDEGTKRLTLFRKEGDTNATALPVRAEDKLKIADAARDVQLLWDSVLFRGANRFDETWLASAKVQTGAVALAPASDVGMLPESGANRPPSESDPPILGCGTDKARLVRVRGDSADFLSFYLSEKWTKPVKTSSIGGSFTCRRAEGWFTRVDAAPGAGMLESVIVQERCTPAACKSSRLPLGDFFRRSLALAPVTAPVVTQLGGKLLVVWPSGERGGVRMRLASIDELSAAPETVLFDDLVQDGAVSKNSALAEMRLFTREAFAILLLRTNAGTFALRITPDGKAAPLAVKKSG